MKWPDAIRYWIAQFLGGTAAALICLSLFGLDVVVTGTPQLSLNVTPAQGILIESILTFFLVFVFHGTGVDERRRRVAGLAIGSTGGAAAGFIYRVFIERNPTAIERS